MSEWFCEFTGCAYSGNDRKITRNLPHVSQYLVHDLDSLCWSKLCFFRWQVKNDPGLCNQRSKYEGVTLTFQCSDIKNLKWDTWTTRKEKIHILDHSFWCFNPWADMSTCMSLLCSRALWWGISDKDRKMRERKSSRLEARYNSPKFNFSDLQLKPSFNIMIFFHNATINIPTIGLSQWWKWIPHDVSTAPNHDLTMKPWKYKP